MKILNASQIREADAYTIANEPISSIDLMERAASATTHWIVQNFFDDTSLAPVRTHVFCGMGNNGGDGLVVARQLHEMNIPVKVWLVCFTDKRSEDFKINLQRLSTEIEVVELRETADDLQIEQGNLVIDSIFGTGLNRPPEGIAARVIQSINRSKAIVASIDMPSGLFDEDNSSNDYSLIIEANFTLSFQSPKLAFFLSENAHKVGRLGILNIGLDEEFIAGIETPYELVDEEFAKSAHRIRSKFSHKGSFGHALIIGGSKGKYGALALAARAALRTGAGLLTVHSPGGGTNIMHNAMSEVMVSGDEEIDFISQVPDIGVYAAIGIGPGMGTHEQTQRAFKLLIQNTKVPLVIDADALNILAENKTWLAFLPKGSILTPHPGEFGRLADFKGTHYQAIQKQLELSQKHGIYILLKGAHSSLSTPSGKVFINSTGNPGMASAGMGDALTGIITAFLSSGYSSLESGVLGMFIHGKAGDLCLDKQSHESLLASDLIENLGAAFKELY